MTWKSDSVQLSHWKTVIEVNGDLDNEESEPEVIETPAESFEAELRK